MIELHGLGTIEKQLIEARMGDNEAIDQQLVLLPPQLVFIFKRDEQVVANTLDRAKADMRIDDQSHECLLTFVNTLSQYDEKTISVSTLYQSYLPTVELSEVTPGEMGNDDHLDFGQSEKLSESLTDAEMLNKSDANTNPSDTTDQRLSLIHI